MKPQQQNTDAKKESAVYVQTPDGGQRNIPTDQPVKEGDSESGRQTVDKTPTQSSSEVTSGEDG
ncbi:hypothetical protein [Flavisolibacter ginsenosidimutans]|uniref:Uncharacterized protein n=1 Tax=Flavisolibacter ginsenosidimutans TaxID=661481 RepID=A0A5B8UQM9_9BACT|nr:hypothetical protein [Flavisolibacter ginsenosidimutans]QEC58290.1 hypothetical protein FSB75_21055 [Flavisolibacter ginsenosidimutans]